MKSPSLIEYKEAFADSSDGDLLIYILTLMKDKHKWAQQKTVYALGYTSMAALYDIKSNRRKFTKERKERAFELLYIGDTFDKLIIESPKDAIPLKFSLFKVLGAQDQVKEEKKAVTINNNNHQKHLIDIVSNSTTSLTLMRNNFNEVIPDVAPLLRPGVKEAVSKIEELIDFLKI